MIESLIRYIEEKGYQVVVLPGALLIRKEAHGQICGVIWAMPHIDLDFAVSSLYGEADEHCQMIEDAIDEYSRAVH